MDWPCQFIFSPRSTGFDGMRVVGFHSVSHIWPFWFMFYKFQTHCLMFDLKTRSIVWESECGGGNRHWQFLMRDDVASLYYIRDEVRGCTYIVLFRCISDLSVLIVSFE